MTDAKKLEVYDTFIKSLDAVQKTVKAQINPDDLEKLKKANYKMCFAKKVGNNDFNVVWQSYTEYLINNTFSWTPQYQLFGSNRFTAQVEVQVSTNLVQIGLGQESTLSSAGILSEAIDGGPDTSINLKNEFGSIHPGVNQLSTGLTGQQTSTPIYVAENPIVEGETNLTPVEKVLVWFEQNIETSTMFSSSRSNSIEVDLTQRNDITIEYKNQKWSIV